MCYLLWMYRIAFIHFFTPHTCIPFVLGLFRASRNLPTSGDQTISRFSSLTPMGVRALGARMRENCNTPLTLFGYLIFHMSASSFFSSLLCMCQNLSTPPYLLISCFFYLPFKHLLQLRQFAQAIEQCQSKIGQKN